mmetsp:Transcript_34774/g.90206  ORF Transcript_34774/g.90206 Transcript_34774/m.90206 type:complete len:89 (+) Transcript_34774:57-323(+)
MPKGHPNDKVEAKSCTRAWTEIGERAQQRILEEFGERKKLALSGIDFYGLRDLDIADIIGEMVVQARGEAAPFQHVDGGLHRYSGASS